MLTGRDARTSASPTCSRRTKIAAGVDFHEPRDLLRRPRRSGADEIVGPAGPTTSTRMDKFHGNDARADRLVAMNRQAERGPVAIEAIRSIGPPI